MSILSTIFGKGAKEITDSVGGIIDKLSTSDDEKLNAKAKLTEIVLTSLNSLYNAQKDVLMKEMSGNWLQKSWRPLTMLTFVTLLVLRWTGLATHDLPIELESQLMEIIKLGLGGYVIGRSAENITKSVTQNIDLPFLRKKDRKDNIQ